MMTIQKLIVLTSFSVMLVVSTQALGKSRFLCDEKQTYCLIDNKRLIQGDEVLFLNSDDEIVATGEVSDMDGVRRRIDIKKKFADISADDRIIRKDEKIFSRGDSSMSLFSSYQTARKPSKISVGGGVEMAQMNIASDAVAYGGNVFGEYRWKYNLVLVGRAQVFSVSGSIDAGDTLSEPVDYSAQGLVSYAGLSHTFFAKNPVAIRTEADLGFNYISVSTSGSAYPSSLANMGEGLGFSARAGLDAVYRAFDSWKPTVGLDFELINYARSTSLGVGIIKELK